MIDVSELMINPDFVKPLVLKRFTGGFGVEGEYAQSAPKPLRILGSVQHPSPADRARFEKEGERNTAIIKIYCGEKLQDTDGDGKQSDVIAWNCEDYRVFECRPWSDNGYWLAFAQRI